MDAALREVKEWDRLRWDRGLFNGGEWSHYVEVECRIELLEHELNAGRPAISWDDVQARFDWKRYEFERQWIEPTGRNDPFLDRLEADFSLLRGAFASPLPAMPTCFTVKHVPSVQNGRRANAEKRDAVLSMLDGEPGLSDREIGRRVGVSPQTVNNWRRKRKA